MPRRVPRTYIMCDCRMLDGEYSNAQRVQATGTDKAKYKWVQRYLFSGSGGVIRSIKV